VKDEVTVDKPNRAEVDMSGAVEEFFEAYRPEYERADASAITSYFAFPLQVASDTGASGDAMGEIVVMHVASRDEWTSQIDRLLAAYTALGVASARVVESAMFELSPRLFQAVLRWELQDSHGDQVYRFDAAYTLARIDGALRITALAHNERPRLQALLARRSPA
jgi:hypothetical protein